METIKGLKRSHMCGTLDKQNIGAQVTVMGWAAKVRDIGQIVFIDLRDRSGIVQLVVENNDDMVTKAKGIHNEYVVAVVGTVRARSGAVNPALATGEIEIQVSEIRILNKSEALPVQIDSTAVGAKEETRLKYRYLDLRSTQMQNNMMLRHRVTKLARDYYDKQGFYEIETPILQKSTPEGARDYLVPSRVHPGSFYALPQSPQLYKQLLMLSGYDRYMQIAKCFRDEDLRADRQPEFTQIDIEMSFVDIDDVISVNEGFLQMLFKEVLNIDIPVPFKRMSYAEAMERFGSDKPDLRFGMELINISDVVKDCGFKVFTDSLENGGSVRAIMAAGGAKFSRKEIDALGEVAKLFRARGLAWIVLGEEGVKSPITKFLTGDELQNIIATCGAQTGDAIFIVSDKDEVVFDALGNLRLEVAKKLDMIDGDKFEFLWVTEFPLLEYSEEEDRYVAKHHPFTSPMDEDMDMLDTAPEKVRAKAYDVVLNGTELGGGSIRIFNSELQQKMFSVLGFTKEQAWERFGFLMEAFKYGAPPHGGMAYGLDRLMMLVTKSESIRDVIAFPKVQNASELMTQAPANVDEKQLGELHIKITE